MTDHSSQSVHKEVVLQSHFVEQLVLGQDYRERSLDDYDRARALDRQLALEFVKSTQPDEWAKLKAHYTASAESEFFKNLEKALKTRSTLNVLRSGIKMIPGIKFSLCYFKPPLTILSCLLVIMKYEKKNTKCSTIISGCKS